MQEEPMLHAAAFQNAIEQREPVELVVHGQIPEWLQGNLYRTGPGTYEIPRKDGGVPVRVQHWFDGLAVNHKFSIQPGGRVFYSSRKGGEDYETRVARDGRLRGVTFAQRDPCKRLYQKFFTLFSNLDDDGPPGVTLSPDMAGFQSMSAASRQRTRRTSSPRYLVAKTDSSALQLIDPDTLEPLDTVRSYKDIDPRLDGETAASHACIDETGLYNFTLSLVPSVIYKVFRISPEGAVQILATIQDAPATYLHSIGMTQKYVVLTLWQCHIKSPFKVLLEKNVIDSVDREWRPQVPSVIYLIDRVNGGFVAKYSTPSFFAFHHLNAFDDGDDVVVDLMVYDNHMAALENLYVDNIRNPAADKSIEAGRLRRFVLRDVSSKEATRDAEIAFTGSQENGIELATIHPGLQHKPYRYGYGVNKQVPGSRAFFDRIIKFDVSRPDGPHIFWAESAFTPSEPVFIPRPGSAEEDDGVVLSVVLDGPNARSMLVVLDAKDLSETARATMELPSAFGLHGIFTSH
ncbi:carotenoid oxygenase [Auricularia subglabra TFB-10046 SS5]|nr:carotenoid oxygenase [Auricularia subglabra TFB-10046 SS5]